MHRVIGLPQSTPNVGKGVATPARLAGNRLSTIERTLPTPGSGAPTTTTFVATRPTTTLVGREEELELMHQVLYHFLRDGQPQRLIIDGAGGTGKTALLKQFIEDDAASNGLMSWCVPTVWGEGRRGGGEGGRPWMAGCWRTCPDRGLCL